MIDQPIILELYFNKQAKKYIEKQDKLTKKRLNEEINKLTKYPPINSNDIKPLTNSLYSRLQVGKYRIIFQINFENRAIIVHKVNSRGDVYKGS